MNDANDGTGERNAPSLPPLAFIYDRQTSHDASRVITRIATCEQYAETQGWKTAGSWIDEGGAALSTTDRPQFAEVLRLIRHHSASRVVVCLINDWDRLANDAHPLARFMHLVSEAGGRTVTSYGATDEGGRLGGLTTPATFRP